MKLNCVVVDDSTIHRITIAKLVNEHPDLNLIGDFFLFSQRKQSTRLIYNNSVLPREISGSNFKGVLIVLGEVESMETRETEV